MWWFDHWEKGLGLGLGFAHKIDEKVVIKEDQLAHIINIDEIALSLDGADGGCGGRLGVTYYDPLLPLAYSWTAKSSITITIITSSYLRDMN